MRILIIDNDPEDREILRDAISEVDPRIECIEAKNGEVGITILRGMESLPDLVFLDINMPIMNGRDCLIKIKKSALLKSVRVVMYSTTVDQREVSEYTGIGANEFVSKPGNYSELLGSLKSIFSKLS